jgi:hypothetical protein
MSAYTLQTIIDSPTMGGHLNKMRWSIVTFARERHTLLTSDRPGALVLPESLSKRNFGNFSLDC